MFLGQEPAVCTCPPAERSESCCTTGGKAKHTVCAFQPLCRELKEGEPVLISYGNLQNDFLLMVRLGGDGCCEVHGFVAQLREPLPVEHALLDGNLQNNFLVRLGGGSVLLGGVARLLG